MLIKRVVIQGFKTFAQKTEFVFDPGVTAVVGPNGSGKSNIVDAVRWCLGEQSFSLLRSKKTADIIFSGSDRKARLGMAQVSLTLDNSAGEIPIDFQEVEITRRAYRDGDNEYLINNQRVRLLDITELLAQTGLGKRTYAVVGQGLIDRVLSLAPEERRSLFEEAAGITGYQIKRKATLRRLDATQQNLTRVQDIVAELSPRLTYLKRQANRAREREQIADDLRVLLRTWYGYRWHTSLRRLDHSRAEEENLKKHVLARQKALAEISRQIETLRGSQGKLRDELGGLHSQSSDLHGKAQVTGREMAVAQERLRQVQSRLEETQRELAPLRLQKETLEDRLEDLAGTLIETEAAVGARQEAVDATERMLAERQQVRKALQDALESTRHQLIDAQRTQTDTSSRITQIHERKDGLDQELAQQEQARTEAEAQVDVAERELQEVEKRLSSLQNEMTALRTATEELEHSTAALRADFDSADQERQAADRHTDRLQTRYDLLRRLQNEGAGYASGVRSVLQSSRTEKQDEHLDGIVGTVAALIRVPEEYDKAIETALGGALQNVVAESWNDASVAIDYLKRTGRGRVTFLPLDRLHVPSPIHAPNQPGILGNAAEIVSYEPHIADVAKQLLGRVWVAEDLPSARRALDQHRGGPRPTIVTRTGEIVRPGGSVTGGSDRNRQDDSILARERELREIPKNLASAKKSAAAAAERCAALSSKIEQIQVQIAENQTLLGDQSRLERATGQQMEEFRRQRDRAQQAVQWQTERMEQTRLHQAKLDAEEDRLTDALIAIEQTRREAEANQAEAEAEVERAGATDLLRRLADERAAAAEVQSLLRSQRTMHENQRRTHQSATDQIRAKEVRCEELSGEILLLRQQIDKLTEDESALREQIDGLNQTIAPLEAELAVINRERLGSEERERTYQLQLRKDETAWNAAQLQFQRTEDAIQQLHVEIEHDLGLVIVEESEELAYQPPLPLEAFVEQLPVIEEIPPTLEAEVKEMRVRLGRVNNVNPDAPREYDEAASRHEFLITQSDDLEAAARDLRKVLRELDELMEVELARTFKAVAEQFEHFFKVLFNGGTAKLILTEPDDITNTGIEIIARPPGKRPQSLALLSGGERTLSACALIFAILRVSPTPFCIFDEVDAALDEANVDRFRLTLEELTDVTQFIIVTHNRRTLEGANAIYGVTMGNDGVSRVISLRLDGDKIVQTDDPGEGDVAAIEEIVQM